MKFRLGDIKELDFYTDDSTKIVLVDRTKWTQDSKYQYQDLIFYHKDNPDIFYLYTISRSGSPFTDWHYDWEYRSNDEMVDCQEVKKVAKTIYIWE